MGVDCKITLPDKVRIHDVADVIGMLLGQKWELVPLDNHGSKHLKVEGVSVKNSSVDTCADIFVGERRFFYHFEWSGGSFEGRDTYCGRGLMPSATAENIALGVALVQFFGGIVDFNDCDESDCDFAWPEQPDIRPNDGEAWERFQQRMASVRPLTKTDIAKYKPVAAY